MATFLSEFLDQLDEKWQEIDILLGEAKKQEDLNYDLYNALCRSITVLLVAHLEGFTKELVRSVSQDLNKNCSFSELPQKIQNTYCIKYIGNPPDKRSHSYWKKVKNLSEKFSELEANISFEPFLTTTNKNPKPDTIKLIFSGFGVENVFSCLHDSELDNVFSGTNRELKESIDKERSILKKSLVVFPYSCQESRLNLKESTIKVARRTLWQEFLDEINRKRHEVAHGNDFDNTESVDVLETRKDKVVFLQLGLIELLASVITKNIKNI
ncbi:MAG: MAE_28990/MAE_18760 family HEPN-like nuclease [Candidatus Electrothrix sp. YB6]